MLILSRFEFLSLLLIGSAALVVGCAHTHYPGPGAARVEVVAESPRQWTGVAVAADGRLFVNYPRWSDDVPVSVAVIEPKGDGTYGAPVPYPNRHLNAWKPGLPARDHFVCAQSVVVDAKQRLWVLDPANPQFRGVVPGGPKLVHVDVKTSAVMNVIHFKGDIAPPNSYLNDVRIDTVTDTAYITDSGAGALVVVDLKSGDARRLLAGDPSTQTTDVDVVIDGKPWRMADGSRPRVHSDGIALSPDQRWLYWQALHGTTLYRMETRYLRDAALPAQELASHVERVAEVGPSDGIEFAAYGALYLTTLERNAITRWNGGGETEIVAKGPLFAWPDSLAFAADGALYVTTSQIHLQPNPPAPYRILRVTRNDDSD